MDNLLKSGEHVMGVDIGGTKVMATLFDHQFKAVVSDRRRIRGKKPGEKAEDRVRKAVAKTLDEAKGVKLKGIGVGSPGPLDPVTGVIIDTPNIEWKDFPLADFLAGEFGVPVVVDNDVNVGTYGEWSFGEVRDCQHVLGMFPGTGIGGGIIIDGKVLHGFSGAAGEVGHMTMQVDGPLCGCGKRGCLEGIASRSAIAKEVAALAARGDAPTIAEECGADLLKIRSGVLADAVAAGEKAVEDVLRRAAYFVGIGTANLINVLSPEAVVLGGGLVEAMPNLYLEEVHRAVEAHAMPFLRRKVRIVEAKLGDDAVVMGAARLIADKLAS